MKLPTLAYALICSFAAPAVAQQPQKAGPASQPQLEERVKKLEDRADNADVQTKKAALDTDYIQRVQKQYETYYEKVLSTQATVFSVVGILLTIGLFVAARFSFNVFERLTKSALAEATAELRNDYARALATEVQKLKDANATDIEKLKNALTSKIETLEADLKSRTDLQIGFVQGRASIADEQYAEAVSSFHSALKSYKLRKTRNLTKSTKSGVATILNLLVSIRNANEKDYLERTRAELADPVYDGLEEELASVLQYVPWVAPLVNERKKVASAS